MKDFKPVIALANLFPEVCHRVFAIFTRGVPLVAIVTLIEGKVVVENNNGDYLATLNPSDQIRINKLNGKFTLQKVDTVFYNCLAEGKLLLNDTKLSDLTKILKRWYSFEIKFMDKKAGDIKISGTIIKNKPLDLFLKVLERSYGIKYEMVINDDKKDEILIYKN